MSKRQCQDCDGTEDVRPYPVQDYPEKWGPYYLCANCRAVLDAYALDALRSKERALLASWGTRGERRAG